MTNTEKVNFIFATLEKAGVRVTDLARLARVSRESLYRWKRGAAVSDMLRLDLAYTTTLRLKTALDRGKLPLHDVKPKERTAMLRRLIMESK